MKIKISSFGWKHSSPPHDAGYVIDCRDMRNPHSIATLRPLTGLDAKVQEFVARDALHPVYLEKALHEAGLSGHVAFGCFGGRHRSVAMAEMTAAELRKAGADVVVNHCALGVVS